MGKRDAYSRTGKHSRDLISFPSRRTRSRFRTWNQDSLPESRTKCAPSSKSFSYIILVTSHCGFSASSIIPTNINVSVCTDHQVHGDREDYADPDHPRQLLLNRVAHRRGVGDDQYRANLHEERHLHAIGLNALLQLKFRYFRYGLAAHAQIIYRSGLFSSGKIRIDRSAPQRSKCETRRGLHLSYHPMTRLSH
jgi:hypothetical protein